jgi:hypothetical protein
MKRYNRYQWHILSDTLWEYRDDKGSLGCIGNITLDLSTGQFRYVIYHKSKTIGECSSFREASKIIEVYCNWEIKDDEGI